MAGDDIDAALSKILNAPRGSMLIVDLDHTLHLGNSTEDFIDCAKPATLAATGLAALHILRPWRLSADPVASRDHWRILFIVVLFPWTLIAWHRRVQHDECWNAPLVKVILSHTGPVLVASNGYRVAVAPRVRSRFQRMEIVARPLLRRGPRRLDKADRVIAKIGSQTVGESTVITDSEEDLPLLDASRTPILLIWPNRQWRTGLAGAYVPLRYTVARHGHRFLRVGLLKDDIVVALLAVAVTATSPMRTLIAVITLTFAIRCVYDLGYHENDHLRPPAEPNPKLHNAASQRSGTVDSVSVIFWAELAIVISVLIAGPGGLVRYGGPTLPVAVLVGSLALIELRIAFALFNRSTRSNRRWIYPFIEAGRYGTYLALFPAAGFAFVALAAQASLRWAPYLIYRHQPRTDWPDGPWRLVRLAIYLAGLSILWPSSFLSQLSAVVLAGMFTIRARRDVHSLLATNGSTGA